MTKKTIKKAPRVRKSSPDKQATGLYQSPIRHQRNFRPVYYSVADTPKAITAYDRLDSIKLARSLFTTCPDLGGAILQKSSWVVGPGAFTPLHTGTNAQWGDTAEAWLVEQFFPVCSLLGPNYPFNTLLNLTSNAIDIDGDSALVLSSTRDGFPQVGLIPSHRIGCRKHYAGKDQYVEEGSRFAGYRIVDGVILNDLGRPIGYRILGDTEEDDTDIAAQNVQVLYEAEWCDQLRGISRIARSVTDWAHQEEINEFLLRGIKLASSVGIIHKTEDGSGDGSGFLAGATEDPLAPGNSGVQHSTIAGGEIYFLKSAANESIEAIKDDRPSQNSEDFIKRIQARAMYSIGWPAEMLDSSKIGGASVRLVQDLVRRSIATRQTTLERRARMIVIYGIAKAMKEGILPQNNGDWFKWSFTRGAQITVDNGNEQQALREGFKLGTTSLQEIASIKGVDWYELRNSKQRETEDLIDRAKAISTAKGIDFGTVLTLLQQNAPNQMPVAAPVPTQEAA